MASFQAPAESFSSRVIPATDFPSASFQAQAFGVVDPLDGSSSSTRSSGELQAQAESISSTLASIQSTGLLSKLRTFCLFPRSVSKAKCGSLLIALQTPFSLGKERRCLNLI